MSPDKTNPQKNPKNDWMSPDDGHAHKTLTPSSTNVPPIAQANTALRAMDLLLLGLTFPVLLLLLPLVLWAAVAGKLQSIQTVGARQQVFTRWRWYFPTNGRARWLTHLGAAHWPTLLNILRGDMAWVGPRARLVGETTGPAAHLRPGITGLHQLRQATAVDFMTELVSEAQYTQSRGLLNDVRLLLLSSLAYASTRGDPSAFSVNPYVQILDVRLDNLHMETALQRVLDMVKEARPGQVSFVNPACANIAAAQADYRQILANSDLVLPDGIGMKLASQWLGTPIRQNVNGTDFFPRLCHALDAQAQRLFLLGASAEVVQGVADVVHQRWPQIQVVGAQHGYLDPASETNVARDIQQSGAQVVLVAMGVPLQERFIARHLHLMGPCVAIGVGGLFDFVAGRISRAPQWMRDAGLEWVWRLIQEPKRMWKRYLLGNVSFLIRVALQRAGWRPPRT